MERQKNKSLGETMQIIFLPEWLTLILCFIVWFILQSLAAFICYIIPDRYYKPDSFIFKSKEWEKEGKIYNNIFKITKWKKFLPDGAAVAKNGYRKKHLNNFTKDNLEKFIIESCRGEMSHWLAILPFWLFGFFCTCSSYSINVYLCLDNKFTMYYNSEI